jgi:beta-lactamase class A
MLAMVKPRYPIIQKVYRLARILFIVGVSQIYFVSSAIAVTDLPDYWRQDVNSFKSLPGETSLLVKEGDSILASVNADQPLAVASTFKLAVLAALKQDIEAGNHRWDEVIPVKREWKSLPSGILQDWPDNAPVTLQTIATLMVSMSDNTATDMIINVVGRDKVEAYSRYNKPLLTTREAFALKNPQNEKLLRQYRQPQDNLEEIIAKASQAPLPAAQLFTGNAIATDIEWQFSSEELCQLIESVVDLPLMSINPGVVDAKQWRKVAFKGGAEPGIVNLTTWLEAYNGKQYCVAATWNSDRAISEALLGNFYQQLVEDLIFINR